MELSKPGLDVGLITADLWAVRRFYADVLGLAMIPASPRAGLPAQCRFSLGSHVLELTEAVPSAERDQGGVDKAHGMRLLAFIFDDLDSVLARFNQAQLGYRKLPLPEAVPFRVAFSSDPDGNALELVGLRRPAGDAFGERLQIGLTVADPARTNHFYSQLLGFPEQPEMQLPSSMGVVGDIRHAVTAGGTTLKFWQFSAALPTWTGAPDGRTGIRVLRATVPDVDAAYSTLAARDVPIVAPPRTSSEAVRSMTIADPDGNWIELVAAPAPRKGADTRAGVGAW